MKRLPLVAIFLWAGCGKEPLPSSQPETSVPVSVQILRSDRIAVTRHAPGVVRALDRTELATRLAGRIAQIEVRVGERVGKGQLLARIDADDLEAAVARARADLDQARAGLALAALEASRAEALHAQQVLADQPRDRAVSARLQSVAAVDAAQRSVDEAEARRTYGFLRAPFDGVVVRRLADAGDLASPGTPVLVVERTDSVRVVASIPESDVAYVTVGDLIEVQCGGTSATATVHSIVADETIQRSFQIQLLLSASDQLRAGRFARLTYQRGMRSAVRLPTSAVVQRGQLRGAFVVQGTRAQLRWVRLGREVDGMIEVLSGLDAGDRVVVGSPHLRDGALVHDG